MNKFVSHKWFKKKILNYRQFILLFLSGKRRKKERINRIEHYHSTGKKAFISLS